MRLVAQPLHEIKHGVARLELERLAAGHEEGLHPGVAVRAFGDGEERDIGETQRGQCLLGGAELAAAAVDDDEIGPGRDLRRPRSSRAWRPARRRASRPGAACCGDSAGGLAAVPARPAARGLLDQPLESPAQDLAHHAEVVAGREVGGADVELAVLVLLEAFRPGDDHGADRVRPLDVTVVVHLDAPRQPRQREGLAQRVEQLALRGGLGELARRAPRAHWRARDRRGPSSRRAGARSPRPCGRSWCRAPRRGARAPRSRAR